MQIGDQQRAMFGPIQRGIADYAKRSATKLQVMRQGSGCDWGCDSPSRGMTGGAGAFSLSSFAAASSSALASSGARPPGPRSSDAGPQAESSSMDESSARIGLAGYWRGGLVYMVSIMQN